MSSGTLISDLDSAPQLDGDGDLIQKIMADMNSDAPAMPQPKATNSMISSPNPNSTFQRVVDNAPATAHVIGHDHPSPGDFQAAIDPRGLPSGGGDAYAAMGSWQAGPSSVPPPVMPVKKSWYMRIAEEMKMPVIVALLVFLFSLPVINIIIGSYIPSLVKSTGDLTTLGLLLKSGTAGFTFWLLQRVIVPLLSM
jgi:hypothetical protein